MWLTSGPRYILRRNYGKTLSFAFFLGRRLNVICHLFCLRYFLSPLFHNMMLRIKTFKTKKFITVRTESFYFLCCRIARFPWLLFSSLFIAISATSADIPRKSFHFFQLVISEFALRLACRLLSQARFQIFGWCTKD